MSERPLFITAKVRGVIMREGKLFFCKLAVGADFYCLPGGTLELGESRKDGLKREFIEELGVEPVIGDLLYTQEFQRENGVTTFDFWYEIKNADDFLDIDLSTCSHGFEHSEVGFYSEEDLKNEEYRPLHIWDLLNEWKVNGFHFVQNNN